MIEDRSGEPLPVRVVCCCTQPFDMPRTDRHPCPACGAVYDLLGPEGREPRRPLPPRSGWSQKKDRNKKGRR